MELSLWILLGTVLHARYCYLGLDCPSGVVEVTEGTNVSFSCGFANMVEWTFGNGDCPTKYTATCTRSYCSQPNGTSFHVETGDCTWTDYCGSRLNITKASREHACNFSCTDYVMGETDMTFKESCKLRVKAPARYTPGSCRIGLANWWIHGSCTAEGMYDSDNNYTCQWLSDNNQKFGGFEGGLVTYKASSKEYKRGHCAFVGLMPTAPGLYKYSAKISPGPDVYFEGTVNISHPEELMHNCPKQVLEGSDLTCTCTTSKVGSPPAQTIWDGLSDETLQVKSVTRQFNGKLYTCRLLWGPNGYINRTTPYTLRMAYGPAAVVIHRASEERESELETAGFICTAIDVFPSAVFTWSHTCRNRTDSQEQSTCSFSLNQLGDIAVLSCTVNNSVFASVSSSYTYSIRTPDRAVGRIIGGVIAAIIGIIGAVRIVTLIIKRRQSSCLLLVYGPGQDSSRRSSRDERILLIPRGDSVDERSLVYGSETPESMNDQPHSDVTINNSQLVDGIKNSHFNFIDAFLQYTFHT
ncbi:uncharacterized protein LOC112569189 [Pomacea canaliculata]|uniref:uncharacterized protein LOC112569189 n=1 Tax=Pomacea canaliculata TaxID=400727 RepID=UPI000D72FC78|nr:uncharacterized protein LOC112569189 [Pomacea canaliculata]